MEGVSVGELPVELRCKNGADGGLAGACCAHDDDDHNSRPRSLRSDLAEEFAEQHVEMVNAIFAFDGVASAIVSRRTQAALHIFAEAYVFLLYFISAPYRALDSLLIFRRTHIVEKPLEDGECFFVGEGHD